MKIKKNLSLYIHIPFCVQKCKYCDFLSFSTCEGDRNSYIQELKKELIWKHTWTQEEYQVISIFFGGGTPSLLTGTQMEGLLSVIDQYYDVANGAEITIEANPGTLTKDKLSKYLKAGMNRLSIGLQSANNQELAMLGRIHTYEEFIKNYDLAREVGFENINIDLMAALPGQTYKSYQKTLQKVVALKPEHISAYSLIVEEGTPLAKDTGLLEKLPDEDLDRDMYQLTKDYLRQYGYERYEISNYSKPGKECRHNCVYWSGGEYLGFGLGASSYFQGQRFVNESDFTNYRYDSERHEVQVLSRNEKMEEFMFLGMRMTRGVSEAEFARRFDCSMESVYGDILKRQEADGLIIRKNNCVQLTDKGLDISNYVFCDYLLE
ncbi:MAG: radical SAM family heme chaperone HemW [Lachnospiraceae bacterium]|nr:radical SAM family heme chaperone HemW [Lachnospiraceae bacterium]